MDAPTDEGASPGEVAFAAGRRWLALVVAALACAFVFLLLIVVGGPNLAIVAPLEPPLPVSLWFLWLAIAPFAIACWLRDPVWPWAAGAMFLIAGQLPRWLVPAVDLPGWLAEVSLSSAGWIVPAVIAGISAWAGQAASDAVARAIVEYREWRS